MFSFADWDFGLGLCISFGGALLDFDRTGSMFFSETVFLLSVDFLLSEHDVELLVVVLELEGLLSVLLVTTLTPSDVRSFCLLREDLRSELHGWLVLRSGFPSLFSEKTASSEALSLRKTLC